MSRVPDTFQAKRQSSGTPGTAEPAIPTAVQDTPTSWQRELAAAVRTTAELRRRLDLPAAADPGEHGFPVLVPQSFLNRMKRGDASDPLLLQVLPHTEEGHDVVGFAADAVGDLAARRAPGLIQKYAGRVLFVAAGACAVHCRYCFRREYPYQNDPRLPEEWVPALREIAEDKSVTEVILSGGDPLMLSDSRLELLCRRIDAIPHIERIRFHSRLPIVIPSRVTSELITILTSLRAQTVFVVHANHGNEIADDCAVALRTLVHSGIPILNQAVLLRRVNDSADALELLSRRLVNLGVMPYYLHQLDRVSGTAHYEVDPKLGLRLIDELAKRLPGYALPRFVREIPGQPGKTTLLPTELQVP